MKQISIGRSVTIQAMSLLLTGGLSACQGTYNEQGLDSTSSAITGTIQFDGTCSAENTALLVQVMFYGRTASASPAFKQCVAAAMRGNIQAGSAWYGLPGIEPRSNYVGAYMPCLGRGAAYQEEDSDPHLGETIDAQIDAVVAASRSVNSVVLACSNDPNAAAAHSGLPLGAWAHGEPGEPITWRQGFLDKDRSWLSYPPCGHTLPMPPNCRPYEVYPYSTLAGVAWHESLHNHGYHHGDNSSNANASRTCAQASTYAFDVNAATAIVEHCLSGVIETSETRCGAPVYASGLCTQNQLRLVDDFFQGTSCSCVTDPSYIAPPLYPPGPQCGVRGKPPCLLTDG